MIDAELFISVLGASSYTFAQNVRSQRMEDWIRCHIKAFEYLGGCPEVIVPDNCKVNEWGDLKRGNHCLRQVTGVPRPLGP